MSTSVAPGGAGAVVCQGHLRKLKTMKKKFFVLRAETTECSARLEYYGSEKKYRAGALPRRTLSLKSCYNITRRLDLKQKHVIALFTREEQFCVVAENEKELHTWLTAILRQHRSDDASEELLHPIQHVWQVSVQKKGLGASKNIQGLYNLCLTDKTLTLVKIKSHNNVISDLGIPERVEYSLKNIRTCGDSECFFYMEVGRQTATGAGEIWMLSEDSNIAQSMHSTVLHAMRNCAKETENEKDHIILPGKGLDGSNPLPARRQTYSDGRGRAGLSNDASTLRNRCDSMPSRVCTSFEAERPATRHTEGAEASRDEPDGAGEWHRAQCTPRIPEEPDYCEMTPREVLSASRTSVSVQHSRTSSLTGNETPEGLPLPPAGYMPMAPSDRGLVSASSGSVCSGTPSTDPRFSEYQLDHATSHIIDEDERPPRAYSVGSRPAPPRPPDARHRAYSVGARHRPPPAAHKHNPSRASASAPLLPRTSAEDLMELDFSKPQTPTPVSTAMFKPPIRNLDEYVDMSPRNVNFGYMEMRPGESFSISASPPATRSRSPPPPAAAPVITTPDGYVEMNYGPRPSTRPIAILGSRPDPAPPTAPHTPADEPRRRTPLGSQTIFPLSLDSPASPVRPEDRIELVLDDAYDDTTHPLTTVREISEEGKDLAWKIPEISCSPQYVQLARPCSRPIATPTKSAEAEAEQLSCNPTATKCLARPEGGECESATLVRAGTGGAPPARFTVPEGSPVAPAPAAPAPPSLNYAALDLDSRGVTAALTPHVYTQIDFVRSEKLHADAN